MGARRADADYGATMEMKIIRATGEEILVGDPNADDEARREAARAAIRQANERAETAEVRTAREEGGE